MPSSASTHSLVVPPSSLNTLPSIFIVPGSPSTSADETHTDPWCFFDGSTTPRASTPLNTDNLDDTLYMLSRVRSGSPPTFHRTDNVVLPKKHTAASAAAYDEQEEQSGRNWMRRAVAAVAEEDEDVGNDSMIVEVIKVRKHACDDTPPVKRSKTLRLRALNTFKIFKSVGKTKTDTVPPPTPPPEFDSEPQPKSKTLGRSRGKVPKLTSKSSPSLNAGFSKQIPDEERPKSPAEEPPRAASPNTLRSTRHQFSKLSLSRMFQGSQVSTTPPQPFIAPPMSPQMCTPAPARSSSGTSEDSTPPITPPDESPSSSIDREGTAESDGDDESHRGSVDDRPIVPISSLGEMQLDSLHFDELSFDATRF